MASGEEFGRKVERASQCRSQEGLSKGHGRSWGRCMDGGRERIEGKQEMAKKPGKEPQYIHSLARPIQNQNYQIFPQIECTLHTYLDGHESVPLRVSLKSQLEFLELDEVKGVEPKTRESKGKEKGYVG